MNERFLLKVSIESNGIVICVIEMLLIIFDLEQAFKNK